MQINILNNQVTRKYSISTKLDHALMLIHHWSHHRPQHFSSNLTAFINSLHQILSNISNPKGFCHNPYYWSYHRPQFKVQVYQLVRQNNVTSSQSTVPIHIFPNIQYPIWSTLRTQIQCNVQLLCCVHSHFPKQYDTSQHAISKTRFQY